MSLTLFIIAMTFGVMVIAVHCTVGVLMCVVDAVANGDDRY
jgi:hypothetical protein